MNKPFSFDNPLDFISTETRSFLGQRHKLFIGGESVESVEGGRRDVVDPATGKVISNVADATASDVDLCGCGVAWFCVSWCLYRRYHCHNHHKSHPHCHPVRAREAGL